MFSFVVHFHKKNRKQNKVHFSYFILKELGNELIKNIKINFVVIFTSMVYTLFKSKFMSSPLRFFAVNGYTDIKNLLFKSWFILIFILLAATFIFVLFFLIVHCNIKKLAEAAIVKYFTKVAPKVIHKLSKSCKS